MSHVSLMNGSFNGQMHVGNSSLMLDRKWDWKERSGCAAVLLKVSPCLLSGTWLHHLKVKSPQSGNSSILELTEYLTSNCK